MKKNATRLRELAALHSLGALDGDDAREFSALLEQDPDAQAEARGFAAAAEALARSLPSVQPPASLKDKILRQAEQALGRSRAEAMIKRMIPAAEGGLAFIRDAGSSGWVPLAVSGAFVKVLAFDETNDYAVVLGKLEPGSRYPAHRHRRAEDIYMLAGDLHVGDEILRAGDFHHADSASEHGVNWSETGCVLLAVLSKEDLFRQIVR